MTTERPATVTRSIGRWRVHAIQAGWQRLDGGAMFGVVPKPLWERRIPADDLNRIPLGMRCLLVEHDDGLVLIDTGVGNKENEKFRAIYGIENDGLNGGTWLEDSLRALGFSPGDIHLVINTHFHFDHAGGNTRATPEGTIVPSFPNARYVVQRGELEFATRTNERTAASYFPRNWDPLIAEQRIDFVDGEPEILPGISVLRTPGHVPHHQSVLLDGGNGEKALFLGDVCPTHAHLPLPWIMGYDVEPLVTLESKRRILKQAVDEDWLLIFEHDATVPWGRVAHDGKGYSLRPDVG
ncbi:MAG: MBL fold metallo-hydrolase [Gemmatimonadaceae bacterium]